MNKQGDSMDSKLAGVGSISAGRYGTETSGRWLSDTPCGVVGAQDRFGMLYRQAELKQQTQEAEPF
jgi:hypothetical protein